jgi:hypothetical protein
VPVWLSDIEQWNSLHADLASFEFLSLLRALLCALAGDGSSSACINICLTECSHSFLRRCC